MKKHLFYLILLFVSYYIPTSVMAQEKQQVNVLENTALVIIDIQDFYFPGGALPLSNPKQAALNAQKLLLAFRETGKTVIHVKHKAKTGSEIHELVSPIEGEKVITKEKANSFVGTDLLAYLKSKRIENLILCGMQTHMCLEAATRAASDYGFHCTLIEDACATRELKFGDITISAKEVHYSTLSTLQGTYSKVESTQDFLKKIN